MVYLPPRRASFTRGWGRVLFLPHPEAPLARVGVWGQRPHGLVFIKNWQREAMALLPLFFRFLTFILTVRKDVRRGDLKKGLRIGFSKKTMAQFW